MVVSGGEVCLVVDFLFNVFTSVDVEAGPEGNDVVANFSTVVASAGGLFFAEFEVVFEVVTGFDCGSAFGVDFTGDDSVCILSESDGVVAVGLDCTTGVDEGCTTVVSFGNLTKAG